MNRLFFALRRSTLIGLSAVLALALVACAPAEDGGDGATAGDGDGTTATVTDGVVEITTDDMAFSADTIEAPAGEAFTIRLENLEAVPHNIAVFTEEGGDLLGRSETINEGQTSEVAIDALEPGEYFFVCEVHFAEMQGTLVVEG